MTFKIPREGYYWCECRDCFDVVVADGKSLCPECQDAGCEADYGECKRADAYGVEDEEGAGLTGLGDDLSSGSRK